MAKTKAQQKAVDKYIKANYDRIEFKVPKGHKDEIKACAEKHEESINSFINRVIDEAMKQNVGTPTETAGQPQAATALLSPDTLKKVQNATGYTGETVQEFIARAVTAQAKWDETKRRMGLNPVTGVRLEKTVHGY